MPSKENKKKKQRQTKDEKEERESLVIWRSPVRTVYYAFREVLFKIKSNGSKVLGCRKTLAFLAVAIGLWYIAQETEGPHHRYLDLINKKAWWCLYWVGLGILSSIGLASGLHTFILYLGPHIANVTLAAYECSTLDFPEPPYPEKIICSDEKVTGVITVWRILGKVYLEAMMWGVGTAIGELPPYFMARASRLSGHDPDDEDEDLQEFEDLQKRMKESPESLSLLDKTKIFIENMVKKVGFFGILLCSSFPNPLFDLCGITCGHFLVPFKTFFGAVVLGKSCIKVIIQAILVIIAFSDTLIERIMEFVRSIPNYGPSFQQFLEKTLHIQKEKLHQKAYKEEEESSNILGSLFETMVFLMVSYFVISIVNSFAQTYHKRISKKKKL